jgi:D-glycero-D-manno-heptose 1,7-bisphosphate phosphatase
VAGSKALFIDRDGVINELVRDAATGNPESPLRPADVTLIDGAAEALRELSDAGWLLVGVTNQPAAAKGTVTREELEAVHDRVIGLLAAQGVRFDAFRLCLHHPDGVVPELSGPCDCRKPAPGMLLDAARELDIELAASWMIGDTDADVVAGRAAGCHTMLVEHGASDHKRSGGANPDAAVPNLQAGRKFLRSCSIS